MSLTRVVTLVVEAHEKCRAEKEKRSPAFIDREITAFRCDVCGVIGSSGVSDYLCVYVSNLPRIEGWITVRKYSLEGMQDPEQLDYCGKCAPEVIRTLSVHNRCWTAAMVGHTNKQGRL